MVGKVEVVLYNNKVHYRLTVKRNITVLRGDSATGKSELIRLLTLYNSNPKSSGITLICERECSVLNEGNWELFLRTYSGRIFSLMRETPSFVPRSSRKKCAELTTTL